MDRGFVVLAQNNSQNDYIHDAFNLALSLHCTQKNTPRISLITNNPVPAEYRILFEHIIPIPYNDSAKYSNWKIQNRWKIYHASPYTRTIVLDADILATKDLEYLWNDFEKYNICFSTNPLTYRNEVIKNNSYRTWNDKLPDIYSTVHFFKKSDEAKEYYTWLESVMKNWEVFYKKILGNDIPDKCSVDLSSAIVNKLISIGDEYVYHKPCFVHMKHKVLGINIVNQIKWTQQIPLYLTDNLELYAANYKQNHLFHYADSDIISKRITDTYRKYLGV